MVFNNGFAVKIISDGDQDKLKRGDYNYVALNNNTEYSLQLINTRSTDAMAEVYIENELIGTWFIPAKDEITIHRPVNIARRFTFLQENDRKAINAGVISGESSNGLIRVIFYPKKRDIIQKPIYSIPTLNTEVSSYPPISQLSSASSTQLLSSQSNILPATAVSPVNSRSPPVSPRRTLNYQSGATVLGRQSYQQFNKMRRFSDDEIDWNNKTEIIIRLVVKPDNYIYSVESSTPNNQNLEYISVRHVNIPPRIDEYNYPRYTD